MNRYLSIFVLIGIGQSQMVNICTCNLSTKCDSNCCCDTDCTTPEKDLFSSCLPLKTSEEYQQACSFSKIISTKEEIINQEVKSTSAFCVAINNQGGWDYKESDVLTTETIDQIIENSAGVNSWPNMDYNPANEKSTYKVGSIVHFRNSDSNEIRKLSLPAGKFSRQCIKSPTFFKTDASFSCLLKNDEKGCTSEYASYEEISKIQIDSTGAGSNFTTPTISCKDSNGILINPCRASVFDSGTECRDAVTHSQFIIFTDPGTGLISSVEIELTLETLAITSWIPQNHKIDFMRTGKQLTDLTLSGNPGYLPHKPVRLGLLVNDQILESNIFKMTLMNNNQCNQLTSERKAVLFGSSSHVTCTYELVTGQCSTLQANIDSVLDDSPADIVGKWGNSLEDENDWIEIVESQKDSCSSSPLKLVTGKHYTIVYQNTGNVINPQPKIIGMKIAYDSSTSGYTDDDTNYKFILRSSVTFVDASSEPEQKFAAPPKINVEIPADFLYPFRKGN